MNNKWRVALTSKVIVKVVLLNISEAFEIYDALPYMNQKYSTKHLCPILLVNYAEKTSDIGPISSKEFPEIQGTTE